MYPPVPQNGEVDMKKNPYFINVVLCVTVGLICAAGKICETFSPATVMPMPDIPFMVLLCVISCVVDYYVNGRRMGDRIGTALIAGLIFSLLPLSAQITFGIPVWKLFAAGTAVFFVTDVCYGSIAKRMSSGRCGVFAPAANGVMLFLAAQCLQGFLS